MPIPIKIQKILDDSERQKKVGDLDFARSKFHEAIESYSSALLLLAPLRATPYGELCALRCFSNQIQCYLRLGENEKALAIGQYALTIPIAGSEIHLTTKIYSRCAIALENLKQYEAALNAIDQAISLDANSTDLDATRNRLIVTLSSGDHIFAVPPRPIEFPPSEVTKVIGEILKCRGDPEPLAPLLNELCVRRVNLDRRDEKNYNIMWALCQSAVLRSTQVNESADDVFPLLQLILMNGARPEQRFLAKEAQQPDRKDRSCNQTPLMLFALAGAVDCVKLLLKSGASVMTCDDEGWTPILVACAPNNPRVPKPPTTSATETDSQPISAPTIASNDEMVELLIDAKSPINMQNYMGLTPLACAAQAGDVQSAALLIHAGAKMNLRSANGFSPIVWAFTATNPNHEMIQLLLDACLTPIEIETNGAEETGAENPPKKDIMTPEERLALQLEYVEDMKCFKLGQLCLNLKIILKEFLTKYENTQKAVGKEVSRPPAYVVQRKIAETIGRGTGVVVELGGSSEINPSTKYLTTISSLDLYSAMLDHLKQQFFPEILFKRWSPVNNPQQAVMSSPPLDQARLSILMKGVTGPNSNEPPLSHTQGQDYLLCGRYPDYRMLIRESMVSVFSPCVSTRESIERIIQHGPLVVVLAIGTDYWVKNLQEMSQIQSISFDLKLVRATTSPLYFIENHGIETVSTLSNFSQTERALMIIWPMCNMMSTTTRDLVEKDEQLIMSFEGKKIILIGDIDYNPLNRDPAVKNYLTTNYECVDTIALPNWHEFNNSVTIWSKLG